MAQTPQADTRQALEQGCGKQTPSARKLFFQANLLHVPNLVSKCRGHWDLGLCTTSGLAFGERRSGDFRKKNVFRRRKNRILSMRCGSPNASPEVVYRPKSRVPPLCWSCWLLKSKSIIDGFYSKNRLNNWFTPCHKHLIFTAKIDK